MIHNSIKIRRTWLSQLKGILIFAVLCMVAVFLSKSLTWTVVDGEIVTLGSTQLRMTLPTLAIFPFVQLGYMCWKIYDALFTIDSRGVEMKHGVVSLNLKQRRVRFEDIRSMDLKQSIIERVLDTGHVGIASAATGNIELRLDNIYAPRSIKELIQAERDRRIKFKGKKSAQVANAGEV